MKIKDIFIGLLVIVIWGLNFIAIKLGLKTVSPIFLGALRFLVVALPAVFFVKKPPISWKNLFLLALSINVGQFALLFIGMSMGMPAGISSLVLQAQVIFTPILGVIFLKEKWKFNQKIGSLIAVGGLIVIAFGKQRGMTATGFMLTLMASACWSTGNIVIRQETKGKEDYPMLALIIWAGLVSVIPLVLLSLLVEGPAAILVSLQSINGLTVLSIGYIAYLSSLVGYGLWGKLLSSYDASKVAPFSLLVPVVGITSAAIILGEHLTLFGIFGTLLIMIGLIISVFSSKKNSR